MSESSGKCTPLDPRYPISTNQLEPSACWTSSEYCIVYGFRKSSGTAARDREGWAAARRSSNAVDGAAPRAKGVGEVVTAAAEYGGLFSTCCTVLACSSVS